MANLLFQNYPNLLFWLLVSIVNIKIEIPQNDTFTSSPIGNACSPMLTNALLVFFEYWLNEKFATGRKKNGLFNTYIIN